ncbi:putative inactive serine/threonine-protein kinase [Phytophthora fragariae]|uniref:Putative inactive serine/threonine-protein kinase n=1 Tax=Phytophthora fragariae TaxID=53985 RepID=A0A6A3KRV8_9STRA|nr:putative inactive serine/threonine-protein kinase [Phytophthora fragariae]KAE8935517.1 putative inactive serine/threonine-protein kinase [Phytophthora fragariae]KAE9006563.1 putative inactive serine/threonine-protein kinase [Phytophthora fragariae]KAE9105683.1 putative inactive serine/threonine-protein kinase [Phytophthora fragariae]KAE9105941.1 putative inactive serine/threonine-protein kinase [Phytophthora fragariae]
MNFLKTLGGLVGASATGGLPYSMDTPSMDGNVAAGGGGAGESVVFEGLPDFVLHSGRSKADPSHAVSIFKSRQPAAQPTQNALRRIKTLRHPNLLAFLDGTEMLNNGPVVIVTEHVMPLSEFLTALRMEYGATSEEFAMCVSWGLRSILMALQFINVDCKMLHGRLTPQSIFVTKGGDWKLGGFELTAEITSDGPSYIYTAFQQYADINYKSPECQRSDWKAVATGPSYGVDIWAFACLMYYIFNDGQVRSSDLSTAANIPPAIRTQFRKAIDDNAARRPSPQKMLSCSYFETPFIKRMDFLENLAVKDSDEKVAFYKELCANLETLPRCFGVHKILPALKQVVEFGATGTKNGPVKLDPSASHMLPAMVQIGSSLSAEEFKADVLPIIIKLFSCNDRAVRVQLLQMMEKFTVHFDAKLVNSSVVFDNLCSGFTDAAPVLRELTVKSMLHIADKLSDSNLNNRVMKYFAKLQTDPEPAIRTNTTICLGKIASKLNDATRPKVLFPAFAKALRDPFPHARLAGLRSMTACQEYFTPQGMAGSIVPAIAPLLIDVSITVRDQAKISMDLFMKKVMDEAAQMKIREEQEVKERELKRASGEDEHVGGNVASGATPPPSNGAHSSAGYASSLTAWASSAVASNVNKLVGSGGSSSALSASGSSVAASSSRTSSFPSSTNQHTAFGSTTAPSSKNNSFNAFPADDLAADEGWGDDDLDELDSPKRTSSGFGSSLSANRGTTSSFTSPSASSLSASLSSSSSSAKLSVSRNSGAGLASSLKVITPATSTFAINSDSAWDDNWGGDDDLDLDVSVAKATSLNVSSQKSSSGLNTSTRTSSFTTNQTAPGSSGGLTSSRKTASERRAEAQAKAKAKHEPLGAMKLSSTAGAKTDDWNWDF